MMAEGRKLRFNNVLIGLKRINACNDVPPSSKKVRRSIPIFES